MILFCSLSIKPTFRFKYLSVTVQAVQSDVNRLACNISSGTDRDLHKVAVSRTHEGVRVPCPRLSSFRTQYRRLHFRQSIARTLLHRELQRSHFLKPKKKKERKKRKEKKEERGKENEFDKCWLMARARGQTFM